MGNSLLKFLKRNPHSETKSKITFDYGLFAQDITEQYKTEFPLLKEIGMVYKIKDTPAVYEQLPLKLIQ